MRNDGMKITFPLNQSDNHPENAYQQVTKKKASSAWCWALIYTKEMAKVFYSLLFFLFFNSHLEFLSRKKVRSSEKKVGISHSSTTFTFIHSDCCWECRRRQRWKMKKSASLHHRRCWEWTFFASSSTSFLTSVVLSFQWLESFL